MKLTIRYKLLIGFAILVLLSSIIQAVIFNITRAYISDQIKIAQKQKAQNAADEIEGFFADIENTTTNLAQIYQRAKDPKNEGFSPIIAYEINKHQYIRKIAILSKSGRELIEVTRSGQTPEDKLSFELPLESFNSAVSGKSTLSKVYYLESELGPHVDLFTPIFSNKDTVTGVIKLQINLTNLWDIIGGIRQGENGFTYVVDNEGRLLAHPNQSFVIQRPILTDRSIIQNSLHYMSNTYMQSEEEYVNEKNVRVISNALKIPQVNWLIVFEEPASDAYQVLTFLRNIFIFTLISSLILLLIISIFISNNMTRAIQQLIIGTKEIEKGKLHTRLSIKSGDEIESLANSFNTMATSMQEAFKKLEAQKQLSEKTAELLLRRDMDVRDINDELEVEKEKIISERNKLRLTLLGITDAVISLDLAGKVVTLNKAAEEMIGKEEKDITGKVINDIIKIYDGEQEIAATEYAPVEISNEKGIVYDKKNVKIIADNNTRFANVISGKILEGKRINLGCILTFHDLSKENELEAMRLDFVSMAAHELRTPLTTIKSFLSVFIQENYKAMKDEQRMFLSKIYSSTIQLAFLIENLLDVTKIEKGVFIVKMTPVDWIPFIRPIVKDFKLRTEEKHITFDYIEPKTPISNVNVDSIQISEVLVNLLENAISYTPAGGTITVQVEENDKGVVTHVKDTGEGIPPEALPNLFTKFFRVVGKLTHGTKGTGLGLYISKSIIEKHNGKIWVKSDGIGKGATFSFLLPTNEIIGHT